MSENVAFPSELKSRVTTYWTSFCGMPYDALVSWVPSRTATERRYLTPWSSHVTSGLSGSSSTTGGLPGGGHSNFWNSAIEAGSGFSIHFSASWAELPVGAGASDGAADSVGLGEAAGLLDWSFLAPDIRNGARFLEFDFGEGLLPGFWVTPEPPLSTPGVAPVVSAHGPGAWALHATRRNRSCA